MSNVPTILDCLKAEGNNIEKPVKPLAYCFLVCGALNENETVKLNKRVVELYKRELRCK